MLRLTIIAALALLLGLPSAVRADDSETDAAFLGEHDDSLAPKPTRERSTASGVDGLISYARELATKGLPEAALPFLRAATEQAPERADAHYELGAALEKVGRREEARAAFERYLSLAPPTGERLAVEMKLEKTADPEPAKVE